METPLRRFPVWDQPVLRFRCGGKLIEIEQVGKGWKDEGIRVFSGGRRKGGEGEGSEIDDFRAEG
eukprot:1331897-Amorphochlora_amoeboformis.AAC.1